MSEEDGKVKEMTLKEFRKEVGLTRRHIAENLGLSRFWIVLWEFNLWTPDEGVQEELKQFMVTCIERGFAAILGSGLVTAAGWLSKLAIYGPEPAEKVFAGIGAGTLATIGACCIHYAATGQTLLTVKVGRNAEIKLNMKGLKQA